MAEYIDREAAIENAISQMRVSKSELCMRERLMNLPAADVRPVVLCKDCKNRFNIDVCKYRGDDWFCGYGERKREKS